MTKQLTYASLMLLFSHALLAQSPDLLQIERHDAAIKLDGTPDEQVWQQIKPLGMSSHWPDHGLPANKQSEIRLFYDEENLYVSAICYEKTENIQPSTFQRDGNWNLQSDQIALILDTYDDAENGVLFVISPSGARSDLAIRNDAISGAFFNESWNTFWEGEVTYFEGGWQTEIKIPFSILRFESEQGMANMGLSIYRYSAHDKIMDVYPKVSNEYGFFSFAKPSLTQDIQFKDVENKRPIYFTPFVLASHDTQANLPDAAEAYEKTINTNLSAGFSAQYGITNNLNADVSFNTDFAQVEADNQVVNLSRFSLFFPEKRRFFQERSSTFEFNNDGNNKLFYSRKIGLDNGLIVPLWGGVRTVGRSGSTDFGLLTMQSKQGTNRLSENYSVARFRSDILNDNSYLGGMFTSVLSKNGNYDLGYGLDALLNLFGEEYLKVSFAQTLANDDTAAFGADHSRLFVEWEKRRNVGFGYRFNVGHVGNAYDPALGFENRSDYVRLGDRFFYNIWMKESSPLQKIDLTMNVNTFISRASRQLESATFNPTVYIAGKNEFTFLAGLNAFYDNPVDSFYISSDVFITPGEYWNNTLQLQYETPRINLYNLSFGYVYGGFYGGTIHTPSISFGYIPSKYFRMNASTTYNNISIPGFETFDFMISRLTLTCALNVKWTISSFAQYNSAQNLWAMNSRLRFNPRDGVNLYVVYNANYNTNTMREIPELPGTQNSLFVVKYSHTFSL